MPGPKTNEREGTRAVLHYSLVSPYKLRQVIDAIRNKPVHEALDLLRFLERSSATIVAKVLQSAVANAVNNDGQQADELFVSACYVDEGPTQKRWRPRARGRATRIRKRSAHVTIIVSRLPEERLERLQARRRAENLAMRARRVEATRRASAESAEGQSRRERRHPEAFPAPEEGTVVEDGEPTAAEDATVTEDVTADEEPAGAEDAAITEDATSSEAVAGTDEASAPEAANEVAEVEGPEPTDSRGGEQEKDS
jgi:large subunit ribosomal protein L22